METQAESWESFECDLNPPPTSQRKRPEGKFPSDTFVASPRVSGLSASTFQKFLRDREVALVMYYDSSKYAKGDLQDRTKKHFAQASNTTKRENHGYGAIDCSKNLKFCQEEEVRQFPTLRLYAKTECLGTVKDVYTLNKDEMVGLIESAPVSSS